MKRTVLLLASVTVALLLASVATLLVPKERAKAAFPGINGKIAFTRDPDGSKGPLDPEIYTIWFNGNNLTRLTNNSTDDSDPAWSADGKRIAFSSGSTRSYHDIFVMNANGSDKIRITADDRKLPWEKRSVDYDPAFSPNGHRIVFVRNGNGTFDYGQIFQIRADGTNATRIVRGVFLPQSPTWSPDGTRIAYSDRYDSYEPELYVITMRPDGSRQRYLTEGQTPDWSPDGSRIVFSYYNRGIYEMDASGTGEKPLMTNAASDPAFSPGGGKIVFASDRDGDYDLYIMNSDGSDTPRRLTNQPGDDTFPDWQPVQ